MAHASRTASKNNPSWDKRENSSRTTYEDNTSLGVAYGGKWLLANEVTASLANKFGLPYTTYRWRAMLTGIVLHVLKVANGDHKNGRKTYVINDGDEDERNVIVSIVNGPNDANMAELNEEFLIVYGDGPVVGRVELTRQFVDWLCEYKNFFKSENFIEHEFSAPGNESDDEVE